jgi:hypothetical protein
LKNFFGIINNCLMDKFWTSVWSIVVGLFIFIALLWLVGAIIAALFGDKIKQNVQNLSSSLNLKNTPGNIRPGPGGYNGSGGTGNGGYNGSGGPGPGGYNGSGGTGNGGYNGSGGPGSGGPGSGSGRYNGGNTGNGGYGSR